MIEDKLGTSNLGALQSTHYYKSDIWWTFGSILLLVLLPLPLWMMWVKATDDQNVSMDQAIRGWTGLIVFTIIYSSPGWLFCIYAWRCMYIRVGLHEGGFTLGKDHQFQTVLWSEVQNVTCIVTYVKTSGRQVNRKYFVWARDQRFKIQSFDNMESLGNIIWLTSSGTRN